MPPNRPISISSDSEPEPSESETSESELDSEAESEADPEHIYQVYADYDETTGSDAAHGNVERNQLWGTYQRRSEANEALRERIYLEYPHIDIEGEDEDEDDGCLLMEGRLPEGETVYARVEKIRVDQKPVCGSRSVWVVQKKGGEVVSVHQTEVGAEVALWTALETSGVRLRATRQDVFT